MPGPSMEQNLPRRKNLRYAYHDYSLPGGYFITVCTHRRQYFFGDVVGDQMILNRAGQLAHDAWLASFDYFGLAEDAFVVMPNHFHAVVMKPDASLTLGQLVGHFKSRVAKSIRLFNPDFAWQRGYYERVIRCEEELKQMREYVIENPARWAEDKENLG